MFLLQGDLAFIDSDDGNGIVILDIKWFIQHVLLPLQTARNNAHHDWLNGGEYKTLPPDIPIFTRDSLHGLFSDSNPQQVFSNGRKILCDYSDDGQTLSFCHRLIS